MKEAIDGEARAKVHLRKGDQKLHQVSRGARRDGPQQPEYRRWHSLCPERGTGGAGATEAEDTKLKGIKLSKW